MEPVYLQVFIDESEENIQVLNQGCLELEEGRRDDDLFSAMFRAAHTLKGMSATMDFQIMALVTHRLEDVLSQLRSHPDQTTARHVDTVFKCVDLLEEILDSIRLNQSEGEHRYEDVISELDALLQVSNASSGKTATPPANGTVLPSGLPDEAEPGAMELDEFVRSAILDCQQSGILAGVLSVAISRACEMKAPRAVLIVRLIEEHADILSCRPDAERIQSGDFDQVLTFVVAIHGDSEQPLLAALRDMPDVDWAKFSAAPVLRENTDPSTEAELQKTDADARTTGRRGDVPADSSIPASSASVDQTIRVSIQKLDKLMNVVSELTVDKTKLASLAMQIGDSGLKGLSDSIDRLVGDLQSAVMSLRLVPVQTVFQRFPRTVRDLSKTLKKDIRLTMSGLDTELDRTITDEMGQVLVHLIRNAADHGLESPEQRAAIGKPREGTIHLSAYHSGQHIVIEVSDDGRGIDPERIREKAVEKGLISREAATQLDREQVYELMFISGFSTAETLSDISGRGVGLDAVKMKVEALGGRISVRSQQGYGTTFSIQLPLTLSIIDALLVEVWDDVYAIPLANVAQVVRADESEMEKLHGSWLLNLPDGMVPVVDAGTAWYGKPVFNGGRSRLVICQEGKRRVAVAVSGYMGQHEVVNKPIGAYLRHIPYFSGATILGDGRVALIVDVSTWMKR